MVAKALSRFYPVFEELAGGMPVSPEGLDDTARFLADGQYRNPGGDPANFTTSYFHRPEELAEEIKDAGLELSQIVAASGNVKLLPGLSQLLDIPESRDHVLSVLRLLEAEPSLIGMSQNFVAIAQAHQPETEAHSSLSPGAITLAANNGWEPPSMTGGHTMSAFWPSR